MISIKDEVIIAIATGMGVAVAIAQPVMHNDKEDKNDNRFSKAYGHPQGTQYFISTKVQQPSKSINKETRKEEN